MAKTPAPPQGGSNLYANVHMKRLDEKPQRMTDQERDFLLKQLDDYGDDFDKNKSNKTAFALLREETPKNEALYGEIQQYSEKLYENKMFFLGHLPIESPIREYLNQDDIASSTFFREAFIRFLQDKLNAENTSAYVPGIPDLRETDPVRQATTLDKLLGTEGTYLFQQALKEEVHSKSYREAVFNKSATFYPGQKWAKRLVAIIGGASASGKTFATKSAISRTQALMGVDKNATGEPGNFVVSSDGGVVREMSQMRNLVIEAAVSLGYPGISDLQKKTGKQLGKIKNYVKKAVLTTTTLGLTEPLTFASPMEYLPRSTPGALYKRAAEFITNLVKFMARRERENGDRALFIMVQPKEIKESDTMLARKPSTKSEFEQAVNFMGNSRAFKKEWRKGERLTWGLNQGNGVKIPESKKYDPGLCFHMGLTFSLKAFKLFKLHSPNGFSVTSYNDLMVHQDPGEKEMLISKRVKNRWEAYKKFMTENPNASLKVPCKSNEAGQTIFSKEQLTKAFHSLASYRDLCNNLLEKHYSVNDHGNPLELFGPIFLPSEMKTSAEVLCSNAVDEVQAQLKNLETKQKETPGDIEKQLKIMRLSNIAQDLQKFSSRGAASFTNPKNVETLKWLQQDVLKLREHLQEKHHLKSTKTMKVLGNLNKAIEDAFKEMKVKANTNNADVLKLLEEPKGGLGSISRGLSGLFSKRKNAPRPPAPPIKPDPMD